MIFGFFKEVNRLHISCCTYPFVHQANSYSLVSFTIEHEQEILYKKKKKKHRALVELHW